MKNKKVKLTAKEKRVENWFELPMLGVTVLLIVTLAIPLVFELPAKVVKTLAFLNLFIWCTFYIELLAKLLVAKSKWQALKRNWSLVIVTLSPLFIPFRLMRVSRLIKYVPFVRLQGSAQQLRMMVEKVVYNVEYILLTVVMFVFSSAFIMWQVEERYDGSIDSLAEALWWAVIAVATIGHAESGPSSEEGRLFGLIVSVIGTVLFMVVIARVTMLFVQDKEKSSVRKSANTN